MMPPEPLKFVETANSIVPINATGDLCYLIAEIRVEQWDDLTARLERIEKKLNALLGEP